MRRESITAVATSLLCTGIALCLALCLIKDLLGRECPGCGMMRAVRNLLHGNFDRALHYNKLAFIVLPLLFYLYIRTVIRALTSVRFLWATTVGQGERTGSKSIQRGAT
jgi:hypothetical protein